MRVDYANTTTATPANTIKIRSKLEEFALSRIPSRGSGRGP